MAVIRIQSETNRLKIVSLTGLGAAGTPTSAAGGDLSGRYPDPSVAKLLGIAIDVASPTAGQVLKADGAGGSTWSDDETISGAAAGGDLGGTYPNPTVEGVEGLPISGGPPTSGQVLKADGIGGVDWADDETISGAAAGGDLGGTYPNPTVEGIEGLPISSGPPTAGQVLKADGASGVDWADEDAVTLVGDATGDAGANTVEKVRGVAVDATAPTASQVLTASSPTAAAWQDAADGGGASTVQATNDNAGPITEGMPVYPSGADSVDKAKADIAGTAQPTGVVQDASIATSAVGAIQTDGPIDISDWTAVTGAAALVTGSIYYLSAGTAGQLTTTAPTTAGQFVIKVGRALSTTKLLINVEQAILL